LLAPGLLVLAPRAVLLAPAPRVDLVVALVPLRADWRFGVAEAPALGREVRAREALGFEARTGDLLERAAVRGVVDRREYSLGSVEFLSVLLAFGALR
jgi:hypothetical protein